jgi:hypothetical protein
MALKGNDRSHVAGEIQRSARFSRYPAKTNHSDPRVACRAGQNIGDRAMDSFSPAEMDGRSNVGQWRKALQEIKCVIRLTLRWMFETAIGDRS